MHYTVEYVELENGRKPFEEFITTTQSATSAPLEEQPLTDAEINASVHAARRERHAQGSD